MADSKRQAKQRQRVSVVTGATSGIGRELVKALLKQGDEVRVVVRDHPSSSDEWKTLPPGCTPYFADITLRSDSDKESLLAACKGAAKVFHLASAVYNTKIKYDEYIDINVIGTENLLRACLDANTDPGAVVHFIFASSVTVYGYRRPGEVLTEESETKPASPYSESKLMAERVVESYGSSNKRLPCTILRFANFYGVGYEPRFFKIFGMLRGGRVSYIGNAANHLTLVDVKDVISAMLLAAENPKSFNRTYNITDGVPYTQRMLFEKASQFMGIAPPKRHTNTLLARIGAKAKGINFEEYEYLISDRTVSIDRARKELGFEPQSSIDVDGRHFVEQFLESTKKKG